MGHFFQDTTNPSLGHTATYTYDSLNRLGTSVATGSITHNLTFSYDRFGNMACTTNGSTNGPCPNWTFNTNNQITTAGFSYDAAGNLLSDGVNSYQWDGENHLKSAGTSNFTYNAYGWRVFNSNASVSYLYDPSGQFLGGQAGGGGNSAIPLGSRELAEYQGNGANFAHINALGSRTQTTDYAGNGGQAILYYPWGQVWSMAGTQTDLLAKNCTKIRYDFCSQATTHFLVHIEGKFLAPCRHGVPSRIDPAQPFRYNQESKRE